MNEQPITILGTLKSFTLGKRACSDTHCWALNQAMGCGMPAEEMAAQPLAGGIMMHGRQCGMLWGAALAAGMQAEKVFGSGPRAEAAAVKAAGAMARDFKQQNGSHNCYDLCGISKKATAWQMLRFFLFKGGVVACAHRMARFSPAAIAELRAAMEPGAGPAPEGPVSCAAELARRRGATEAQATMVAGLAGGIGLSGGGCGALAAAVWLKALERQKETGKAMDINDPQGDALVERFLKASHGCLDCREVSGRSFANAEEHADHIRQGGCAQVMEALASA